MQVLQTTSACCPSVKIDRGLPSLIVDHGQDIVSRGYLHASSHVAHVAIVYRSTGSGWPVRRPDTFGSPQAVWPVKLFNTLHGALQANRGSKQNGCAIALQTPQQAVDSPVYPAIVGVIAPRERVPHSLGQDLAACRQDRGAYAASV
jgi:hypothetical protein